MLSIVKTLLNKYTYDKATTENIGHATREEAATAIYLILAALRAVAHQSLPLFATSDGRASSSRKVLADYECYPATLPGLSFYLSSFHAMAGISFFVCLAESFHKHVGRQQYPNMLYIRTPADLIDCLPRPEWWAHRQTVLNSPSQASTMVDLVLERNSKLECRPWLIKNDDRPQLISALQRGLLALETAVRITLSSHAERLTRNPNQGHHDGPVHIRLAQELKMRYGGYIADEDGADGLARQLISYDRNLVALLLCRVMECIVHSTSVCITRRSMFGSIPEPFPWP